MFALRLWAGGQTHAIGHARRAAAHLCRAMKSPGLLARDPTVAQHLVDAGALQADDMESCLDRHLLTQPGAGVWRET